MASNTNSSKIVEALGWLVAVVALAITILVIATI